MPEEGSGPTRARLFDVVAAVARLIGETVEVRQVLARVATAALGALAFDRMGVLFLESGDTLRHHTVTVTAGDAAVEEGRLHRQDDVSPRVRREFVVDRIDTQRELDPAYPRDREILDSGIRSIIRGALRSGGRRLGILAFYSRRPEAFTSEDEPVVEALAELVAAALEHERFWRIERERSRRAMALEGLLPTLAQALDVRQVFKQVSEITQGVISHDMLVLSLLRPDGTSVGTHALRAGGELEDLPPPSAALLALYRGTIVRDIEIADPANRTIRAFPLSIDGGEPLPAFELSLDPVRFRHAAHRGMRSLLAVPVQALGKFVGGLVFLSRRTDEFGPEDADLARRVADHVSLALAHQRLAEEEGRAAEARVLAARLASKVNSLTQEIESLGGRRQIVGESRNWKEVLKQATQVAATDTTVLLLGESGTGKEVVARFIHRSSPRADGPYVALNCAALPDQLLESELFGHEKGAFTGAGASKPGQIELAAHGVLLLDEVGEMSLPAQAKLLRVLQEKEFQRLGGTRVLTADVRVVAATNRDLRAAVEDRSFREDLYYRLHVFEIRLPSLRDRREDILPLSEEFLAEIGRDFGRPPAGISREARERLLQYPWPGNVRELRNTLERAAILCEGGLINAEHLSLAGPRSSSVGARDDAPRGPSAGGSLNTAADLQAIERGMVEKALQEARYNKSDAARALGISRKQLYVRLRRFGLD